MDRQDLKAALAKFTRIRNLYRHWSGAFHYTDGVAFLAEHAGAEWLLDHIAAHQKRVRKDRDLRDLQIWAMRVTSPLTAEITCSRTKRDMAFREEIQLFSPFALDEVTLYLEDETLLLPSER
jgi:hypothetical protein